MYLEHWCEDHFNSLTLGDPDFSHIETHCGSYFTSVMYLEHWCEDHFNSLTLGDPDFSHIETRLEPLVFRSLGNEHSYGQLLQKRLPEWPDPMHVFAGPELKITLPGDVQYAAVRKISMKSLPKSCRYHYKKMCYCRYHYSIFSVMLSWVLTKFFCSIRLTTYDWL